MTDRGGEESYRENSRLTAFVASETDNRSKLTVVELDTVRKDCLSAWGLPNAGIASSLR